MSIYIGLPGLE